MMLGYNAEKVRVSEAINAAIEKGITQTDRLYLSASALDDKRFRLRLEVEPKVMKSSDLSERKIAVEAFLVEHCYNASILGEFLKYETDIPSRVMQRLFASEDPFGEELCAVLIQWAKNDPSAFGRLLVVSTDYHFGTGSTAQRLLKIGIEPLKALLTLHLGGTWPVAWNESEPLLLSMTDKLRLFDGKYIPGIFEEVGLIVR